MILSHRALGSVPSGELFATLTGRLYLLNPANCHLPSGVREDRNGVGCCRLNSGTFLSVLAADQKVIGLQSNTPVRN